MQLNDYNIDITECWLDAHFPKQEDKLVFKLMVRDIVEKNIVKYWNDYGFSWFLTDKVIKYMAKRDFKPLSKKQIDRAIIEAFYNTHGDYELRSAGIRRRKKKKNKK